MDDSQLLKFATDLGEIMLRSGAETYRVEDTIERLLKVNTDRHPEVFVTPTGIFACIKSEGHHPLTIVKRVKGQSSNLAKLSEANAVSRDFTEERITFEEALIRLDELNKIKSYPPLAVIAADGVISGAFALMVGSSVRDSIIAFFIGFIVGIVIHFYKKQRSQTLFAGFLGGLVIGVCAVFSIRSGIGRDINGIIIGSIMPLVPGVAITTAIRDLMEGDYVSGVSRLMEAVLIAVAIAGGVGVVLLGFGGVM